jgi:hypothetical protein
MFFFEKKNQKTFASLGRASQERPKPNNQKFFASFFQKRSSFFNFSIDNPDFSQGTATSVA